MISAFANENTFHLIMEIVDIDEGEIMSSHVVSMTQALRSISSYGHGVLLYVAAIAALVGVVLLVALTRTTPAPTFHSLDTSEGGSVHYSHNKTPSGGVVSEVALDLYSSAVKGITSFLRLVYFSYGHVSTTFF